MKERWKLLIIVLVFAAIYYTPFKSIRIQSSINEAFLMLQDYARHHILLCLVPAFFIAGAIFVFVSHDSVIKYFGANAKKWISYSIASVSGTILAVCSCTVLPLFAGIYMRGAGIGPAAAFLYSGPAINVLAIILTARVLGFELGAARAVGAVIFSVVIGLLMHLIFIKEERIKEKSSIEFITAEDKPVRSPSQDILYFALMFGILVFAKWGRPDNSFVLWSCVFSVKWYITCVLLAALIIILKLWFSISDLEDWKDSTWSLIKKILPLLVGGVLAAGFLLGRLGQEALIPSYWIEKLLGGNSLFAIFFASLAGALMYFATLTEVPIIEGLMGAGMGKGPALALLLAGPALSLPNMIVIRSILGTKKTLVFVILVVIMATISGVIFGMFDNTII